MTISLLLLSGAMTLAQPPAAPAFPIPSAAPVTGTCGGLGQGGEGLRFIEPVEVKEDVLYWEQKVMVAEAKPAEVDGKKGQFITVREEAIRASLSLKGAKAYRGGKPAGMDAIAKLKKGDLVVLSWSPLTETQRSAFAATVTLIEIAEQGCAPLPAEKK